MSSVAFIVLDDDVIKYDWTLSSTKELQTDKPKRKHNTNNEHTSWCHFVDVAGACLTDSVWRGHLGVWGRSVVRHATQHAKA